MVRRFVLNRTSESLLRRVRNPADSRSWREFSLLYSPLLTRYARARGLARTDAEDIAQECMRILVKRLPGFEYCRKKGRFSSWLRTVANNEVNRMLSKRRPSRASTSVLRSLRQQERGELAVWEGIWLRDHLRFCLASVRDELAQKTFEAFRLVVLDERPVAEVCTSLDMNRNQVYLAKSRVLRRLKERMLELIGFDV